MVPVLLTLAAVSPAVEHIAEAPWLALSADGAGLVLVDGPAFERTQEAEVGEPAPSTLLRVRGERLIAGPVDVVFLGQHPLAPDDSIWLQHEGLTWTLAADAHGTLSFGDHPHRMEPLPVGAACASCSEPELRWAGDLDRDGRLDLLIAWRWGSGGEMRALLLSSVADGLEHVGLVGRVVVEAEQMSRR